MKPSQIEQSIQLHFLGNPNPDSMAFYEEFIKGLPYQDDIKSFQIGINTNNKALEPDSNITIISYDMYYDPKIHDQKPDIEKYLTMWEESITSYSWLNDTLVIAFDY